MNAERLPLFCDAALAERIERVETQLIARGSEAARRRRAGTSGFVIPIAGGVASFAEEGSPLNKVAGLGFGGVASTAAMDEIERAFAACGTPVQVELAHLVDPAIGALLTERGYRLVSFENLLGRVLEGELEQVMPPGVEVRPSGEEEFEAWLDVVADGVAHPDTQGTPSHEEFPREVIASAMRDLMAAAGVRRYVAVRDGVIAGGASIRMAEGVAQVTGAATAPAHAAGVSRPRCCQPGSPMPQRPAATSPSSPPSRPRSPCRTRSAAASTCSIPVPSWLSSPEPQLCPQSVGADATRLARRTLRTIKGICSGLLTNGHLWRGTPCVGRSRPRAVKDEVARNALRPGQHAWAGAAKLLGKLQVSAVSGRGRWVR
ncbi:hypothetical protein [Streptomyces sp. NPDC005283]|uniref:hypothetical protein n=1 Tax=Streptomyces sp. NPDC005283 TaxID=3156871 RepID=UPI0034571BE2